MNDQERMAALSQAENLIRKVSESLNTTPLICECCGAKKAKSQADAMATVVRETLGGAFNRVQKVRGIIKSGALEPKAEASHA